MSGNNDLKEIKEMAEMIDYLMKQNAFLKNELSEMGKLVIGMKESLEETKLMTTISCPQVSDEKRMEAAQKLAEIQNQQRIHDENNAQFKSDLPGAEEVSRLLS